MSDYGSWGGYPKANQKAKQYTSISDALPDVEDSLLPYGLGRSYGDSCLNTGAYILPSNQIQHFISFDHETGRLCCEAGVSLASIIDSCLPFGWFLPVTPGTKYVTIGGAIANDVHGKNHHTAGSFGNHVISFELLRSDGQRLHCSREENAQWFHATIAGLGLTGFITQVELQLKKVQGRSIDSETIKYGSLSDFFSIAEESEQGFEYTAAWIDCLAKGNELGKGHFIRGNHSPMRDVAGDRAIDHASKLVVPVKPPISMINHLTLKAFNKLYYERQRQKSVKTTSDYDPFFYPLDGILKWNRIYGNKGFLQHQCVIPMAESEAAIKDMLQLISDRGLGSFLVVMKTMGDVASEGLISFSREGTTLAMDFPFQGDKTLSFLNELDVIVKQAGGRLYPAKDARMSADLFQQAYPQWNELESLRDPKISSDFWRRVTAS